MASALMAVTFGQWSTGGAIAAQAQGGSGNLGPKDVAVIPLESVPALAPEEVFSPGISVVGGAEVQVLATLRDPRDVPLERFLYARTPEGGILVHPWAAEIRKRLADKPHSAVAVYVRSQVAGDGTAQAATEPFYVGEPPAQASAGSWARPWRAIGVADPAGNLILPCLEPTSFGSRLLPITLPDTGEQFDPDTYLPPKPWYQVDGPSMQPGDRHEGWVLCLAPEGPLEEVRIVRGITLENIEQDPGAERNERGIAWMRPQRLNMGEWALLRDAEVLGWREPKQKGDGTPQRMDEQVVYRGNVWVSIGETLRYEDGMQISAQLTFEGLDDLLKAWDQLGVRKEFGWSVCADPLLQRCRGGSLELKARGSWIQVSQGWLDSIGAEGSKLWVVMASGGSDAGRPDDAQGWLGQVPAWQVEAQEGVPAQVTTDAACKALECAQPDAIAWKGLKPLRQDGDVPIIPVGQMASGLRVVRAWIAKGPMLMDHPQFDGLLQGLTDGNWIGAGQKGWPRVIIDVESEGNLTPNIVLYEAGGGTYRQDAFGDGRSVLYSTGGRWVALIGSWVSETRRAEGKAVLQFLVPPDDRLDKMLLFREGGPAWRLQ